MRKVALCFLLNYSHELSKESIWKEWIHANKDILNVYFFYERLEKIVSPWIRAHAVPPRYILPTSYFHVVPAYLSLMKVATEADVQNEWFCFLTDSCCPILAPERFRALFEAHHANSILRWGKSAWNIQFHTRANLRFLPARLHLCNDPWFILCKSHVEDCLAFCRQERKLFECICSGGLANESIFAIILRFYGKIGDVINASTHVADWSRMTSATSPHVFIHGDAQDRRFLQDLPRRHPFAVFVRKVAPAFPDQLLFPSPAVMTVSSSDGLPG
jgi:hypothetical protein